MRLSSRVRELPVDKENGEPRVLAGRTVLITGPTGGRCRGNL